MPAFRRTAPMPCLAACAALMLALSGAVRAEVPAGWQEARVGPMTVALPPGWEAMEVSDDFAGYFSGDIAARSGYGFALGLEATPSNYLDDVTALPAGTADFDGVAFEHYTFTADDGEGMAGEGEIYISAAPLVGDDHALVLLTALNAPYADRAGDYAAILATLDLPAPAAAAPAPTEATDPAPGQAEAAEGGTADGGAADGAADGALDGRVAGLGGLVDLALPEGWHSYDGQGGEELGLLPVSAEGSVVLARGRAADALLAEAGAAEGTASTILGQAARLWTWPGTLTEFSDGAGFVTGTWRLHVLDTCLEGGDKVAVLIGGTDRFHGGAALKTLLAGIRLTLPADAAPCTKAGPAPVAAAPAEPAPAPAPAGDEGSDPPPGAVAVAPPPAAALPSVPGAASPYPEDSFTAETADWTLYQNGRYGTFISYPSGYFAPDPAPDAADGRSFGSVDGQASFYVFAAWNALGLDQAGLMDQDRALMGAHREITFEDSGPGWYVMAGLQSRSQVFFRRVLVEGPDGLIQTFEILYPSLRKAEFEPIVDYMASTFGPGTSWGDEGDMGDMGDMGAGDAGDGAGGYVDIAALHTPAKGTAERRAILDAARDPVEAVLGLPVIFVISVLRTDGTWAYLQAEPRNPDGTPLDWARTPLAQDWQNGFVSDVVMVLLQNGGGGWAVADYAVGPTDVYWLSWVEMFGLPEALFTP